MRLGEAEGIAITPDGKTAYVTSDESIVVPIDTATGTPGAPIRVGVNRPGLHDQPDGIVITPDGRTAYVVNQSRPQSPPWHSYEAEKRGLPQPAPDPRGTVTPVDSATNVPATTGLAPKAPSPRAMLESDSCRV